jgi:hypothetical protein
LTQLSSLPARCAGNDLPMRRNVEAVIHQVRYEIADRYQQIANEHSEPPLEQQSC